MAVNEETRARKKYLSQIIVLFCAFVCMLSSFFDVAARFSREKDREKFKDGEQKADLIHLRYVILPMI
jgi:polyferredoxin